MWKLDKICLVFVVFIHSSLQDYMVYKIPGFTIVERRFGNVKVYKMSSGATTAYYTDGQEDDVTTFSLHYLGLTLHLKKLEDYVLIPNANNTHQIDVLAAKITKMKSDKKNSDFLASQKYLNKNIRSSKCSNFNKFLTKHYKVELEYGEVLKVHQMEYNPMHKNYGFWMIFNNELIFVSEYKSDGYIDKKGHFQACKKVYLLKYSSFTGYLLVREDLTTLRVRKNNDIAKGFYIVYNGFKILVTEEMKPETAITLNNQDLYQVTEVHKGIYFNQIGYWILLEGVYVFATASSAETDISVMFNNKLIWVQLNYSITLKSINSQYLIAEDSSIFEVGAIMKKFKDNKLNIKDLVTKGCILTHDKYVASLVLIELVRDNKTVRAYYTFVNTQGKEIGILFFDGSKQYSAIKAGSKDKEVFSLIIKDVKMIFKLTKPPLYLDGILVNEHFQRTEISKATINGMEGYWVEFLNKTSKFVTEISESVKGGIWIYVGGNRLYVNEYADIADGIYAKNQIMPATIWPVGQKSSEFKLDLNLYYIIMINGKLTTVCTDCSSKDGIHMVYKGVRYFLGTTKRLKHKTVWCKGKKCSVAQYSPAIFGKVKGYWVHGADGHEFLVKATTKIENIDDVMVIYVQGEKVICTAYQESKTGLWAYDSKDNIVFQETQIKSEEKNGFHGYYMTLDSGTIKKDDVNATKSNLNPGRGNFYFETEESSNMGFWIDIMGEKKYVTNDGFLLAKDSLTVFDIDFNKQKYHVYSDSSKKDFWIYLNGEKYDLHVKDGNISRGFFIVKDGVQVDLSDKCCSCCGC